MKLYPQAIIGKFRNIKDYFSYLLLMIYLGCSWIRWDRGDDLPSQALMIDLPHRKMYIFSIEIWPEEAYYITGMLILAALGLFFITSLFGRIWCGFGCPHTVFTDLFIKAENFFQGDRNARIKLDNQPLNLEKITKKAATYTAWIAIAFSFAFGWVCYFYDAPLLAKDIFTLSVTNGGLSWLVGLTASTFLFAGIVRQRVCKYMCPYGRFQSAMLDNDTSVVTYHDWRGEPRAQKGPEAGDCIDCGKCVVVCPMGIDIREGLQMPCIGCGLCIDACDSVMEKINKPLGLIAFDSINSSLQKKAGTFISKRKIFNFKTILFAIIFCIVSLMILYSLLHKEKIKFNILRDRSALYTVLPSGEIRNTYQLKIFNKTQEHKKFLLSIGSIDGYEIKIQGENEYSDKHVISAAKESEKELVIFVKMPANKIINSEQEIKIMLLDQTSQELISKSSLFISGENNNAEK